MINSPAARRAYMWVWLALGVLLLALAVRSVDPSALIESLANANPWWVLLGLLGMAVTILAKALRWRLAFYPANQGLRLTTLISSLLIGQTVNMLLPARLGELARAHLVGREEKRSAFLALGTIVAEKTLDAIALLLVLSVLFVIMPVPSWLRFAGAVAALLAALLLAGVLLLTGGREWLARVSDRLTQTVPVLERMGLRQRIQLLADGVRSLRSSGLRARLLLWTAAIWLVMGLTNYCVLLALDIEAPHVLASLFVLAMVHLGVAVPTSPAWIGVFHYMCFLPLLFLGVEESQALAYGFVLHAIVVLPVIFAGLLCLWKENLSLYRLVSEVDGR